MVITGNEFEFKYQIAFLTENLWSLSPKSQFSNLPRSLFADFTPFWSLTSLRLSLLKIATFCNSIVVNILTTFA